MYGVMGLRGKPIERLAPDPCAPGHSSGKRPEHGLTVEQGRFLKASESTDVPYIVTKLAARAFWRCMGSWGSDQISAIDKLRKIIACSRGATAAAGVIFAGLSLAGICSEHSEPLYRQKAGDESFLPIPGLMADSQHAGNAARIFPLLPGRISSRVGHEWAVKWICPRPRLLGRTASSWPRYAAASTRSTSRARAAITR